MCDVMEALDHDSDHLPIGTILDHSLIKAATDKDIPMIKRISRSPTAHSYIRQVIVIASCRVSHRGFKYFEFVPDLVDF